MATNPSVPSIKISKTGPGGNIEPVTPITVSDGDLDSQASPAPEAEGARKESDSSSKLLNGVSLIGSIKSISGDSERPQAARGASLLRETTPVDPVTLSILRRTGTEINGPHGNDDLDRPESNGLPSSVDNTRPGIQTQQRERKKGVSFLSRIMGNKKKGVDEIDDHEGVDGERRAEGMNAAVFSQPIGYMPTHPAPPKYIRVHSHRKPQPDFNQIFLAQELFHSPSPGADDGKPPIATAVSGSVVSLALPKHKTGAIWAMQFSKDGKYLAAGGQDKVVRIWQAMCSKDDRTTHEKGEDAAGGAGGMYSGSNGVRLNAPVFMSDPIQEYLGHTGDILDLDWSKNNFLLSSSMDKTVRLWHVTRKECLCCFQHSDFVTSIAFHPRDDRFFLAGSLDSKLRLWSIPDKSVAFWNELPDLITAVAFTPDGRMAIAGCLSGLCLFYETEGLRYHTQLHVRSTHGRNAKGSKITGIKTITFPPEDPNGEVKILITSNDSRVRIYNARDKSLETKFKGLENTCSQIHASFSDDAKYIISGSEDRKVYIWNVEQGDADKKDKRPLEYFEAHSAIVTVAAMAPVKTKQLLGESGDPLFDLCNPPPVTLVSRSGSISSRRNTAPNSRDAVTEAPKGPSPALNPSWKTRSAHLAGNIIVTADYTGQIKVFRQDCAATKRRNESWETSSAFSKKIGGGLLRRASLGQSSDRASSWRQSIGSISSLDGSISRVSILESNQIRNHSISPRKSLGAISVASNGGRTMSIRSRGKSLSVADTESRSSSSGIITSANSTGEDSRPISRDKAQPPITLAQHNRTNTAPITASTTNNNSSPNNSKFPSSRQNLASSEEEDEGGIFSSDAESEGEAVRCKKCASTSFKAKHNRRGEHKLVCVKCNTAM